MIKRKRWGLLYILIVLGTLAAAEWGCRTVSVMVESARDPGTWHQSGS